MYLSKCGTKYASDRVVIRQWGLKVFIIQEFLLSRFQFHYQKTNLSLARNNINSHMPFVELSERGRERESRKGK